MEADAYPTLVSDKLVINCVVWHGPRDVGKALKGWSIDVSLHEVSYGDSFWMMDSIMFAEECVTREIRESDFIDR